MSTKVKLPKEVVKEINELIDSYNFILLEFKKGYVYLLYEHHKYLDPYKDAPRSKICKSPMPVGCHFIKHGFIYLANKL